MKLEEIRGGRIEEVEGGEFLLVERRLSEGNNGNVGNYIKQNWDNLTRRSIRDALGTYSPELAHIYKGNMMFLDIETCGLPSESQIFMIALSYLESNPNDVLTEMLFARDPNEEVPILNYFLQKLKSQRKKEHDAVVTYNGATFDIPRLNRKITENGLGANGIIDLKKYLGDTHIDLHRKAIGPNRKAFGLPNAGLKTLEKLVFKHIREDDVAGARIVDAYHEFLYGKTLEVTEEAKNGEYRSRRVVQKSKPVDEEESVKKMARVIDHNETDNLSMVAALAFICSMKQS